MCVHPGWVLEQARPVTPSSEETGAMAVLRQALQFRGANWVVVVLAAAALPLGIGAGGCGAVPASLFNPAFVDILDAEGTGEGGSIDNPSGYVPIVFVNKTRFSPQLINYLEDLNAARRLSGTDPTVTDLRSLRPRLRVRLRVEFEDENFLTFEFVDGDSVVEIDVRDPDVDTGIPDVPVDPRLTESDLTRLVASCGVSRVEIEGDPQVFVPVLARTIRVEVGEESGEQTRTLVSIAQPGFTEILPDEVDADLNVTLLRNYGIREAPAPAKDLRCGTMVGIAISGTVSIPFTAPEDEPEDEFIQEHSEVPGYVDTDLTAEASIPGRFGFLVTMR